MLNCVLTLIVRDPSPFELKQLPLQQCRTDMPPLHARDDSQSSQMADLAMSRTDLVADDFSLIFSDSGGRCYAQRLAQVDLRQAKIVAKCHPIDPGNSRQMLHFSRSDFYRWFGLKWIVVAQDN